MQLIIARGGSPPIVGGDALSPIAGVSYKPRTPQGPKGPKPTLCARNDYDEKAAYESYMNPEPGIQSGPGDSEDAD